MASYFYRETERQLRRDYHGARRAYRQISKSIDETDRLHGLAGTRNFISLEELLRQVQQQDVENKQRNSVLRRARKIKCHHWWQHINILAEPDGWQRRCWDFLIVLLVLSLLVTVPLEAFVPFWHPEFAYYRWGYTIDSIFWLDIILNFNASFYHGTELVTDRWEIVMHYIYGNPITHNTGWFWVDLVGNIPFELFLTGVKKHNRKSAKVIKWLKLPKLLRAGRLQKFMGEYVTFAMFIQHGIMALFLGHAFSSWYFGAHFEDIACFNHEDDHRRLASTGDNNSCVHFFRGYVESVTSVSTMIVGGNTPTVDGTPEYETDEFNPLFNQMVLVTGVIFFWILQADVMLIIQNRANTYARHRLEYDKAKSELEFFQLPESIQHRVKNALEYRWSSVIPSQCSLLTAKALSPMMRAEIALHFHGELLHNTSLFAGCSLGCLAAVALRLETIVVQPFSYVATRGDVGRELFMLSRGRVAIVAEDTVVQVVETGAVFGEQALLGPKHRLRTLDTVALDWCELQMLQRRDFEDICEEYPQVMQNGKLMSTLLRQAPELVPQLWNQYMDELEQMRVTARAQLEHCGRSSSRTEVDFDGHVIVDERDDDILNHPVFVEMQAQLERDVKSGEFTRRCAEMFKTPRNHSPAGRSSTNQSPTGTRWSKVSFFGTSADRPYAPDSDHPGVLDGAGSETKFSVEAESARSSGDRSRSGHAHQPLLTEDPQDPDASPETSPSPVHKAAAEDAHGPTAGPGAADLGLTVCGPPDHLLKPSVSDVKPPSLLSDEPSEHLDPDGPLSLGSPPPPAPVLELANLRESEI